MGEAVTKLLHDEIEQLGPKQRRQLLDLARALSATSRTRRRGTVGRKLTRFAGSIPPDDLKIMSAEIEAGCEQVSTDEW
ncbi:MAG TPA: hypothetical protein PLP01_11910 [Phycisphaerae bacterium]|nr:hypothetical protein [Phycisphaerae bacterium]